MRGPLLFGPIEPVIRAGVLAATRQHFEIRDHEGSVAELEAEADRVGAPAVVTRFDELAVTDRMALARLWLGLSAGEMDVLVVVDCRRAVLHNPSPARLADFIIEVTS